MPTILDQMPKGTILGWSDDQIPNNWQVCDGTNNTPNLVERFPIGTSTGLPSNVGRQIGQHQTTYGINGTTDIENVGAADGHGFEKEGHECHIHNHQFSSSITVDNTPPATYIIFIIKMK